MSREYLTLDGNIDQPWWVTDIPGRPFRWRAMLGPPYLPLPWFYTDLHVAVDGNTWNGVLSNVAGGIAGQHSNILSQSYMIESQQTEAGINMEQYMSGSPFRDHSSKPGLVTECFCVGRCSQWMQASPVYSWHTMDSQGDNYNQAYIKVMQHGFGSNPKSFLLHRLLCYAFHGPPPSESAIVAHLCQHKTCLLPWHMRWSTRGQNTEQARQHRKQQDYVQQTAEQRQGRKAVEAARRQRIHEQLLEQAADLVLPGRTRSHAKRS
jgi:hypothetical protein